MKGKHIKNSRRNLLFIVVVCISTMLVLLLLSGCKKNESSEVDERFFEQVGIHLIDEKALRDHIHELNLDVETNDLSIHLGQTLGDERTLYFYLDVIYSDGTMDKLKTALENQEQVVQINIFSGIMNPEDLLQLSVHEIKKQYSKNELDGSITIGYGEPDLERNVATYSVFFSSDEVSYGEEITVLFSLFADEQEGEDAVYAILSWAPANQGDAKKFIIEDIHGNKVGDAIISSFYLNITLNEYGYDTSTELMQSVRIILEDGTELFPKGPRYGVSTGFSSSLGHYTLSWQLPDIINSNEIKEIHVKDYIVFFQ